MRLTCGHVDEEGFVCGRCVSEALKALDEARRDLIAWSTPTVVPLEEDCTRCASNAATASRMAEGYLQALDRVGVIRALGDAMVRDGRWVPAKDVGVLVLSILNMGHDELMERKRRAEARAREAEMQSVGGGGG